MSAKIQAVVLGAGGYVGGELLRLIEAHPDFELNAAISGSRAGQPIADTFGHLSQALAGRNFVAHDAWLATLESGHAGLAIFSAAPHGASASLISATLEVTTAIGLTVHVVDSSADFRYADQAAWEAVYSAKHGAPNLLEQFSCALPEHANTVDTPHVGHPGCFATAALLATVPLISSGLTAAEVFVSGVTGSTGSGRSPNPGTHPCASNG